VAEEGEPDGRAGVAGTWPAATGCGEVREIVLGAGEFERGTRGFEETEGIEEPLVGAAEAEGEGGGCGGAAPT
jgi:hypothetical protein